MRADISQMSGPNHSEIQRAFDQAVNMTAGEILTWLKTTESWKVGFKKGGEGESVGHASGRIHASHQMLGAP